MRGATSLPNPVTARLTANEKSRKRKAFAEIECNGHSKQITRQCKCAALVRMHNLFCVDASHISVLVTQESVAYCLLILLNRLNQGIDYSVTLCQTQEFMLRRFSVLKRYESFRENI